MLPDETLLTIGKELRLEYFPKGTQLLIENQTRIENIILIEVGKLQISWQNSTVYDSPKMILERGDSFGTVSILLNNSRSIRTVTTLTDCFLYLLSRETFLRICEKYPKFKDEFTSFLGEDTIERFLKTSRFNHLERLQQLNLNVYATIGDSIQPDFIYCSSQTRIRDALELMMANGRGSIMVINKDKLQGLVTYQDFCTQVILKENSSEDPIQTIMQTDIKTVDSSLPLLEGLMYMARYGVHNLPVVDERETVKGILSSRDMPQSRRNSSLNLLQKIRTTQRPEDLKFIQKELPLACSTLHQQGFAVDPITRFIAHANDAIVENVLSRCIQEKGTPPCPFAFIVFGSEGREEQTLLVDQDNGFIFQPAKGKEEECRNYFLNLGVKVCDHLDKLGYPHCKGGVMASEKACCLTVEEWTNKFKNWIYNPQPQALLNSQIYFDMRGIVDESKLVDEVMDAVFQFLSKESKRFIYHLSMNLMATKLPLGGFNQFHVETKGKHKNELSLKMIMNHIIEYVRILSLENGIRSTHTLFRIQQLTALGKIKEAEAKDITRAYQTLMNIRLQLQEDRILRGEEATNYLNPKSLSSLETKVFKAALFLIQDLHRKLRLCHQPH